MNRRSDPWLVLAVALLCILGLVMVYSASAVVAEEEAGSQFYFLTRQAIAAAVGLVACIATALTPMSLLRRWRHVLYGATIVMLILVFVPGIQHRANGAARWIGLGAFHIQPSAPGKIVVLALLADYLDRYRHNLHELGVLARAALIPAPIILLIVLEPDFGTTAIVTGLCLLMGFLAGVRWRHMITGGGAILAMAIPVLLMEQYRVRRLMSFTDPWAVEQGDGYHVIQSWIAMHSGGMWGQGLGNSLSKLRFLPEPWTDFVGSVLAEELGLVAMVGLIGLYGVVVWRGLTIARHARDAYGALLAATLTGMIGLEAAFNLGVITGLLPPKGLVLPFISYGATQLMAHLWAVGILLSIAAESQPAPTVTWSSEPAGGRNEVLA
jgi:cell division protein FtsW